MFHLNACFRAVRLTGRSVCSIYNVNLGCSSTYGHLKGHEIKPRSTRGDECGDYLCALTVTDSQRQGAEGSDRFHGPVKDPAKKPSTSRVTPASLKEIRFKYSVYVNQQLL